MKKVDKKVKKIIGNFSPIPKWYGVAYYEYDSCRIICYPIPLNIIVAWWRRVVFFFKQGLRDKALLNAYASGREAAQISNQTLEEMITKTRERVLTQWGEIVERKLRNERS